MHQKSSHCLCWGLPEYNIDTDQQTQTNNMKPGNERSRGSTSLSWWNSHIKGDAHSNVIKKKKQQQQQQQQNVYKIFNTLIIATYIIYHS